MADSENLNHDNLLEKGAALLPSKFQDYWKKYCSRDIGRCETTIALLRPATQDTRVLEVGCFPGVMSVLLKEHGYQLECVDLNPERMEELAKHFDLSVSKVDIENEKLPFNDNEFDHVIFTEVLEHLRTSPIGALQEVYRVLKPGGTLVLSVPNIYPIQRLKFLFGKDYQGNVVNEFSKLESVGHMGHFRLYSQADVEGILKHIGFAERDYSRKGRLNVQNIPYRIIFKLLSFSSIFIPGASFDSSKDAHYSHLYALAKK